MRKHFLVATLAVAIMTVFGYRSYLSQTKNEISEFALANIEALASGDFDMPEWYEKRMTRVLSSSTTYDSLGATTVTVSEVTCPLLSVVYEDCNSGIETTTLFLPCNR